MPAPAGGAGGGASAPAGGGFSSDKEAEALRKLIEEKKEEIAADERHEKILTKKLALEKQNTVAYDDLEKKLKKVIGDYEKHDAELRKLLKYRKEEEEGVKKTTKAYYDASKKLTEYTNTLVGGIAAHHKYTLEIQYAIDKTTGFIGESARARREFDQLRHSLNMTREAAVGFAESWAEAGRLGIVNGQLEKMAVNLQKVYGQAKGAEMLKGVLATPMGRATAQGVTQGNIRDVAQAMRGAPTIEQGRAIAVAGGTTGKRTEDVQRAVRFEQAQAKYATAIDDIKAGMQAIAAAGIPPETAALLAPLATINENVAKIAANTGLMLAKSVMGGGGLGDILGKVGLGGLKGGGAGGLLGGIGKLLKGPVGAGLGGLALSYGGGLLKNQGAEALEQRGYKTGAQVARVGGSLANVGGRALTGAAVGSMLGGPGVGTAVGGVAGALYGVGEEWGADILEFGKQVGNYWYEKILGAAEDSEKTKVGAGDILGDIKTFSEGMDKSIAGLENTVKSLPTQIRAGMAQRGIAIGAASVGRETFGTAIEDLNKNITESMDTITRNSDKMYTDAVEMMNNKIAQAKGAGLAPDAIEEIRKSAQAEVDKTEASRQAQMEKVDQGRPAREMMARAEQRRGQVGQEREVATGRFELRGAGTGNIGEIVKYREAMNKGYDDELRVLREERGKAEADLQGKIENNALRIKSAEASGKPIEALKKEKENLANQLRLLGITADQQDQAARLAKRNADVANSILQSTAYENKIEYMRGQQLQKLAQTREEFLKEKGGTPAEITGAARERMAGAQASFDVFMKNVDKDIKRLRDEAAAAVMGGPEGAKRAVDLEKQAANLVQQKLEKEREIYQLKINEATAGHEQRLKELGVQTSILETVRDSAARTGQSWRVQMQYQSALITVKRQEVEEARAIYANAKASGMEGAALMEKGLAVVQKESALKEAVMGKQRDFLEKAVGRSFGMGGGSKAQPNFSPRIFGEIYKDVTGGQWQGAPKTMEESRQAMGGNIFGAIPGGGGVPGVQPGIGVGGRLNPAAMRPGVNPALRGLVPGLPGAAQVAGGPAGVQGGDKLNVAFEVVVKSDNPIFTAQIGDVSARRVRRDTSRGATMG